jgi:NitT/TauT family transport system permease protein
VSAPVVTPTTPAPDAVNAAAPWGAGMRSLVGTVWPATVVAVVGLVLWELVVTVFQIQKFLIPKPSAVLAAFVEFFPQILEGLRKTGYVAVTGLVAGVLIAVLMALICTRFRPLASALTPLAAALAATPIVALAPVFFKWFGQVEPTAKQAVVAVVVLFPVFVSTSKGLLQVQPVHLELMRTYAVGGWRVLREVRVPNALPYFFTSLKVAASLSVIAAIVAEYFGGEQGTLGGIITQSAGLSRYDRAWAAVLAAAVLGMALYALVLLLERFALRNSTPPSTAA